MRLKTEEYIRKQLVIAASVNLGHIISGYTAGWASPVLDKLLDEEQTPLPELISPSEASWVASSMIGGVLFGTLTIGFLANKIGRKPCIILSSLVAFLGYAVLTVGLSTTWMYCGRIVKGVGVSGIVLTNYMYIGEIASPNIRGIILSSTSVSHTLGILLAYAVGPFVHYRVISYVIMAIIVAHASSSWLLLPESPVYYVLKDREDDAKTSLHRLGRSKDAETELKMMMEKQKENEANNANYLELFTIKSNRKALLINTVLFTVNQGGGIMVVLFYAIIIFQSAASSVAPEIASIILGATQFAGAIVTPFFIDKYGRKTLFLLSTALCTVFLTILGVYFYLEESDSDAVSSIQWLPLFALVSYLLSFSFGVNVIPGTILGETFRPNMRGAGSATAVIIGALAGFVSTVTYSYIVDGAGNYTAFWIYAGINLLGFFFALFVVLETKGKSLMEIEEMLGGKVDKNNV